MSDPETALRRIVPEMKRKADYLILLSNATPEESTALAKAFPEFNLVVTSGGNAEPPAHPTPLNGGKTLLVQVGEKGEYAIVVGFFADPLHPMRDQRVPLDSRFPASPAMKKVMADYQVQIKELGFAAFGARAAPHPQLETNGRFVGSAACAACHPKSYKVWKKAPMLRPMPPWPSWIRRGISIPSASVATSSAGIPASSSRTKAATKATRRRRTWRTSGARIATGRATPRGGREGADQVLQKKMQQADAHHQGRGRRSAHRQAELLVVSRPRQQPGVQFQNVLAADQAQGEAIRALRPSRYSSPISAMTC